MAAITHEHAPDTPHKMERIQNQPNRSWIARLLLYLLVIAIGIVFFMPFILAAIGSFKTSSEITAYPPHWLPAHWLFQNWIDTWNTDLGQGATFPRWLLNTAFLSVTIAVLQTLFCSMAAYAFARLKFPGRDLTFSFMLGTMMIPSAVTLIPAFVLMGKLHLLNTFWSLILPGLVSAGSIFMLTQFFRSVPLELEEAIIQTRLVDGVHPSVSEHVEFLPAAAAVSYLTR
jgi:multiple sugar transport system permease protein